MFRDLEFLSYLTFILDHLLFRILLSNLYHFFLDINWFTVLPTLYLSVEGQEVDEIVAFENEEINITCGAEGAFPAARLAWRVNDMPADAFKTYFTLSNNSEHSFDSVSTLRFKPKLGDKEIACVSTLDESESKQVENASLIVYALPTLDLFMNDRSVKNEIIKGFFSEDLVITCHASRASFPAHLTWKINNIRMHVETNDLEFKNDDGTYDSTSILRFRPQSGHKTIACVNTFGEGYRTQEVGAILVFEGIQIPFNIIYVAVPVCFIALLVIILNIGCCIYKKLKGSLSESTNVGLSLLASSTKSISDSPSSSRKTPQGGIKKNLKGPQNLELPEIPTDLQEHEYAEYEKPPSELKLQQPGQKYASYAECDTDDAPSVNYSTTLTDAPSVSYSTTLTDVTQAKIFYGQDMRKLKKINTSKLYDRWTGTITLAGEKNQRVVYTTVREEVLSLNKVHWDKFVKRAVQLPESKHLVRFEGIGIDNGRHYLINERLTWGTLNARLKLPPNAGPGKVSRKPLSPSEVMRVILGVLEGIDMIQASGFLHPGLSSKKVLLSNRGICKLYDFCLSEDAINILRTRKPLSEYSLNELAPEGIKRNTYSSAGDVWSTAVVFWEILSGSLPFYNDNGSTSTRTKKFKTTPPKTWPENYKQLSNEKLFACWDNNETLRPTINELKLSFQEILKSVDTYNLPQVYGGSMAGCYLPMKEATKLDTKIGAFKS
ncbi:Ephrin type-A receptor 10 [Holothuria leucospilota]|uniref:Ephrin type-A receptor 10 n=1 Tax=Holothuria leucospilota TaxID=206669 RepID=A0A9Q0YHB5_HOLLE|nr:Ephrin type-A receptor 10 [Holothuria leucospilota]